MDLRINGKGLLAAGMLAISLVSANFVSIINADSSGGIVVATPEYTVGAVVLRMDNVNPATIYGGTWSLIDSDASLRFGDGSNLSGETEGESNNPLVPLPLHTHNITHNHTGTAASAGAHTHSSTTSASSDAGSRNRALGRSSSSSGGTMYTNSSGAHTHSLSINDYSGNSSESGVADAKVDVRGKYVRINVWRKISN